MHQGPSTHPREKVFQGLKDTTNLEEVKVVILGQGSLSRSWSLIAQLFCTG